MKSQHARGLACLLAVGLLAGCATPQPALQQASHTAKLMGLVDKETAAFQRVVGAAQAGMVESLGEHRKYLAERQAARTLDDRARASAGDSRTAVLRKQLLDDADAVAAAQAAAVAAPVSFKAQVATLLTPLPGADALTQAQAKAAVMGAELSSETRRTELLAFLKGVRDSVDENKKKIDEAKAEAEKAKSGAVDAAKAETKTMPKDEAK
ncbi:hypothetical protein [Pseudorhodoferax sp.]|uniref:hypothetical protein n=1 Tax=Pseudorhodoferax sp. TaxID=1993553 RepID=UPI002DD69335|nr:hypothetical protein [Pseudorhodoferax sp.]